MHNVRARVIGSTDHRKNRCNTRENIFFFFWVPYTNIPLNSFLNFFRHVYISAPETRTFSLPQIVVVVVVTCPTTVTVVNVWTTIKNNNKINKYQSIRTNVRGTYVRFYWTVLYATRADGVRVCLCSCYGRFRDAIFFFWYFYYIKYIKKTYNSVIRKSWNFVRKHYSIVAM